MKSPIDRRQFLSESLAAAAIFTLSRDALALGGAASVRDFVITAREATVQVGAATWDT